MGKCTQLVGYKTVSELVASAGLYKHTKESKSRAATAGCHWFPLITELTFYVGPSPAEGRHVY